MSTTTTTTTSKPSKGKASALAGAVKLGDINRRLAAEMFDLRKELMDITDNGITTRRIQSHLKVQLTEMRRLLARLEQADRDA